MLISTDICNGLKEQDMIIKIREDMDFFACIYQKFGDRLLRYIQRISAVSKQEAEDILQDAFVKVWKNLNGFNTDLKLSSWLYRIVHNETISHWRKDKWTRDNPFLALDDKMLELMAEDLDVEEDCCPDLTIGLHSLPIKYQEVLILKYFEEMSYEEISDVLKMPEGTVATRINRAKQALTKILNNN